MLDLLPSMMPGPRRAVIIVEYDGKDITEAVSDSVISFTYTDKASGEVDEVRLDCHDREGYWIGNWYPKLGSGRQG